MVFPKNKVQISGLLITVMVLAAGLLLFAMKYSRNQYYRQSIPDLPALTGLSEPLKDQLQAAHQQARHKPGAENLGKLGMVFNANAFYPEAMQCYQLAIRRDSADWVWSYYLGNLNKEMGDAGSARDNFRQVVKLNPNVYLAWYYLGKAYQNTGEPEKAAEVYRNIADLPDEATVVKTRRVNYSSVQALAKFELARMDLQRNELDRAERWLLDIVRTNHTISQVYRLLGNVYAAKGDPEMSRKNLIRAQDLAEVTAIADTLADNLSLLSRSDLYLPRQIDDAMKSANPLWAQDLLKHALHYLTHDKYLISKAIKFYLRMDNGKESLPYLERHFRDFNDDPTEMMDMADMLYRKGFYGQSLPYFGRAVELSPENKEIRAGYALSCWKANRKDSAQLMMDALYRMNPTDPRVLANEVDFMLMTGDKRKALFYLEAFRQVAPGDAKVPKLEAMIAETEGNPLKAIPLYEVSYARDPKDQETVRKLGNLLIGGKHWDKAVKFFRKAQEHHPNDPHVLERLGTLLISCPEEGLRNVGEGLEYSERAFYHISSPSNTMISAARSLAQGFAVNGNFPEAERYITIAVRMASDLHAPQELLQTLKTMSEKIKTFRRQK